MGFQKGFLWGGASAANQYEGGIFEGGRGLANVDVCPAGKDRNPVITGHRKMLEMDKEHTYPGARAVDFTTASGRISGCLEKWDFRFSV